MRPTSEGQSPITGTDGAVRHMGENSKGAVHVRARWRVIDNMVALEGFNSSVSPCDWCGRPGTVR
jgi:hypothetical protein